MNYKFTLAFLMSVFISIPAFADNPGEEPVEAPVAVEETTTEPEATDDTEEVSSTPVVSNNDDDDEVVQLQKVIVTGSRVKRTQIAGALPLLVITKEDIDAAGFRNVTEALQALPSGAGGNQGESEVNTLHQMLMKSI
jgi:hypothetical protein